MGCISVLTPFDLSYRPYYGMPYFDIETARIKSKNREEEATMSETISSVLVSQPFVTEVEEKVEEIKIVKESPTTLAKEWRRKA